MLDVHQKKPADTLGVLGKHIPTSHKIGFSTSPRENRHGCSPCKQYAHEPTRTNGEQKSTLHVTNGRKLAEPIYVDLPDKIDAGKVRVERYWCVLERPAVDHKSNGCRRRGRSISGRRHVVSACRATTGYAMSVLVRWTRAELE